MGFFDTIEIEDEAPATSSVQPSDDGTSIQPSTSSNFFSAVEFDEDDDANTMPTSKPTVDTSHITDQDMYSFLSDIKASTMEEDTQAVRYAYSKPEDIETNKDAIKAKMVELNQKKADEKLRDQVVDVQANIDAIYNKYNIIGETKSLLGNKEAQAEVLKEVDTLKKKKIMELESLGIQAYFSDGDLFVVNDNNQAIKVDSPDMFKSLYTEKAQLAGAIMGGLTGARAGIAFGPYGAVAGGIVGSAAGAFAGSGADALLADLDLINKAESDAIWSKMADAGVTDAIFGVAGSAVVGAATPAIKHGTHYLKRVYDYMLSNNPEGAVEAIMKQTNMTKDEALVKYNEYKKLMNITDDANKTDAQKIAEVSVHSPGSERILYGASGTDNSSYITQIANDVFNRADKLITQADEIVKPKDIAELEKELATATAAKDVDRVADIKLELQSKDMYNLIDTDLRNYVSEVKDIYKTVKDAPTEYLTNYKFDINKLAIEPLLDTKGKHIADETIRNRWLGRLEKIEDLSNGTKTFQDLQELYKYVNQLSRDTPKANVIDSKALESIKTNISNEINQAAKTHIPAAEKWLDAWSVANKQYSVMKQMEENVLYKALDKPAISTEDVVKSFMNFSDAGDDTFIKVMEKLPLESQKRVEGAVFSHFLDRRTSGIDKMKAIDFPVLAKDLGKIQFKTPELQQAALHINQMAQVFKNDINLAKASGRIATPHFQSYLTTDPIVRAKFAFASHVFNRIGQLKPGESADNFAAYKLMGKVFKDPLDQQAIKLLDNSLSVKDRRTKVELLDTKPLLQEMQQEFMIRKIGLEKLYGKDVPPLLTWKSNPNDLERLKNPDATILTPSDKVLFATAKGTVGSNPSEAMLTERASDLFTEFIFKTTSKPAHSIQDTAEELLNSKRYDSIIKDLKGKITHMEIQEGKAYFNKIVDRETTALIKTISSMEGYKPPKDMELQLRRIVEINLLEKEGK